MTNESTTLTDGVAPQNGKLVYVAGPYTEGLWEENIRTVIDAGDRIMQAGHTPFIPHTMTTLWALVEPKTKDEWLAIDLDILKRCDCLVRIDGDSEGADAEVEFARENNISVYSLPEFLNEHSK